MDRNSLENARKKGQVLGFARVMETALPHAVKETVCGFGRPSRKFAHSERVLQPAMLLIAGLPGRNDDLIDDSPHALSLPRQVLRQLFEGGIRQDAVQDGRPLMKLAPHALQGEVGSLLHPAFHQPGQGFVLLQRRR
jgi:hypothetical protein